MRSVFKHLLVLIGTTAALASKAFGYSADLGESLLSPDGQIEVRVGLREGVLYYAVTRNNQPILNPSALGLAFAGETTPAMGSLALVNARQRERNATWTAVWGKSSEVVDRFRELTVRLQETHRPQRELAVIFRAYDDGVAFRYFLPEQAVLARGNSLRDLTEFNFAADWPSYWMPPGGVEYPPVGPWTLNDTESANPPVLVLPDSGLALALHEAALIDYAPMRLLRNRPHSLRVDVAPVPLKTPFATPWRVLMIADRLGGFAETRLLETLSPPSRIADTSWIQPGKAVWDRRIRKLTYGEVYYWFNTKTFTHLINFAAANNIPYLLMDSNWYGNQHDSQADPLTPDPRIDLEAVLEHGKERGVKVLLYVNEKAFASRDLDEVFATFHDWGVAGVKYGFMQGQGYEKVRKTMLVIEAAVRHRLLINFHDNPIHPTGLQRTFPNLIALEFCQAQLDAIRAFSPGDYLRTVFIHMLAGPLDMNNGFFALDSIETRATAGFDYDLPYPPIYATVAAETARVLITDTGLSVLPDAPKEYARKDNLFAFIRHLPNGVWDETRVLHAEIGKHITTARRHGRAWFIGSVVDEHGGSLAIALDFLEHGVPYTATLYEDADDSHYQHNREAYRVRQVTVDAKDTIIAKMAPGGGHAAWLRPE